MAVERIRARSKITGQVVVVARSALRHFPDFEPVDVPPPTTPAPKTPAPAAGASAPASGRAAAPGRTPAAAKTPAKPSPTTVKKEGQNG